MLTAGRERMEGKGGKGEKACRIMTAADGGKEDGQVVME